MVGLSVRLTSRLLQFFVFALICLCLTLAGCRAPPPLRRQQSWLYLAPLASARAPLTADHRVRLVPRASRRHLRRPPRPLRAVMRASLHATMAVPVEQNDEAQGIAEETQSSTTGFLAGAASLRRTAVLSVVPSTRSSARRCAARSCLSLPFISPALTSYYQGCGYHEGVVQHLPWRLWSGALSAHNLFGKMLNQRTWR